MRNIITLAFLALGLLWAGTRAAQASVVGPVSSLAETKLQHIAKVVNHLDLQNAPDFEHVLIFDLGPDVNLLSRLSFGPQIAVSAENWHSGRADVAGSNGESVASLRRFGKLQDHFGHDRKANISLGLEPYVGRWRLSEILQYQKNFPRVGIAMGVSSELARLNKDIRSQLADGGLAHHPESEEQSRSLQSANNDSPDTNFENVFVRRLLLLIGSIVGGLGLCFWGAGRFDHRGLIFGAAPLIAACVLACCGWGLFGATLFQRTGS